MTPAWTARLLRAALCAGAALLSAGGSLAQEPPAPHPHVRSRPIPGQYIVVFKHDVADPGAEAEVAVRSVGGRRHHTYSRALRGFSATLSDQAVALLRGNPSVAYIEQDQTISIDAAESPATWGLDRIDQADRPLDTLYHYDRTGAGVRAFIIDTGILAGHNEFTGRLQAGYTAVADGNGTNDCNGHGTHVAGTVGGTTWGVAKGVTLIPVRVLGCDGSGTISGVIAGIDWVAGSSLRPAVANMSLGGGFSPAMNAAVANAVAHGVVMVVAAGNDGSNACNYSPASEPSAITVGATTSSDARATYSNYGTCVDIFAPGSAITSAWSTGVAATNTISGTSMATPHVTGVAALVAQANPGAAPAAIASFITGSATPNRVSSTGTGSPNLLLYSLGTGTVAPVPVQSVAVKSLAGSAALVRYGWWPKAWLAKGVVTVRDVNSGANVASAIVTGSFSPGNTAASCVTGSTGSCTLSSGNLSLSATATVLTITGISGSNLTYASSQNTYTQITIVKPAR